MSDQSTPGWYPDPSGEHELRFWDGVAWMDNVAEGGSQPAPGWYADPSGEHELRHWDGRSWSERVSDDLATTPSVPTRPPASSGGIGCLLAFGWIAGGFLTVFGLVGVAAAACGGSALELIVAPPLLVVGLVLLLSAGMKTARLRRSRAARLAKDVRLKRRLVAITAVSIALAMLIGILAGTGAFRGTPAPDHIRAQYTETVRPAMVTVGEVLVDHGLLVYAEDDLPAAAELRANRHGS